MRLADIPNAKTIPWGLYPEGWDPRMNAIELAPVVEIDTADGFWECERQDGNPNPDFYSLYGYYPEPLAQTLGCCHVIGDFQTYQEALEAGLRCAADKGVEFEDFSSDHARHMEESDPSCTSCQQLYDNPG